MGHILGGFALIGVGVLHVVALRQEWSWFMNNYQVKGMINSWGESGLRNYTYLISGLCIVFGLLTLFGLINPLR